MDEELKKKLEEQAVKIDSIYKSVEKMRKYFLITFWLTIALVVIPGILLTFVLPNFLGSYTSSLNGL